MKPVFQLAGLFALVGLTTLSCAQQQNAQLQAPQGLHAGSNLQLLSTDVLSVVDKNGQPIANATILLGYEQGNPFPGNVLTTDAAGNANIPADWKAALPVTVTAPGYISSTIPVALPGELDIMLTKQEGQQEFEVRGTATDFGRLVTDGNVDFALVIPALSREQMLGFDLSTVISPKTDTISIIGNDVDLPSNIALPRQTENYIFPITLDKPDYRSFMRDVGQYLLTAIHGKFPLQRVVNDIRAGKSIFEVINHFTFIEGGQKTVDVQGNLPGANIAVNSTPFSGSVNVTAPNLSGGQVMVGLSLNEQNGLFVPNDLKRYTSGQTIALKANITGGSQSILALLLEDSNALATDMRPFAPFETFMHLNDGMKLMATSNPANAQDFQKLSFAILPAQGTVAPQFLPLINKPTLANNVLTLDPPAVPNGLTPVATYLVFSEVETVGTGKVKSEKRTRLWEVWSHAWLQQVELPKMNFTIRPDRKYRWEVMFMARPANFVGADKLGTRVDLNTVTHVTRNAMDL